MEAQVVITILKALENIQEKLADLVDELRELNTTFENLEYDLESKWI